MSIKLPVPPKNPTAPIPAPPGMARPHFLALAVGKMGSGKTTTAASYVKALRDAGSFNRVFLISPTYFSNRHLWAWIPCDPSDCFTELSQAGEALQEIVRRIKAAHLAYKTNAAHWEAHEKHTRGGVLTHQERVMLEQMGPPLSRLELIRPCVILDDLQSTQMFNSSAFKSLVLRMRHVCHDPQVGLSFVVLCQSLKNGFPRALRSCVSLWFLFATRDTTVIKDIAQELSGRISPEEFTRMFEYATDPSAPGNEHAYMCIDLTQGGDLTFRRKLVEPLRPADFR